MTRCGILVVGSVSADVTAFAPRLPRAGETVLGDHFSVAPGGKGANQAIAAASFGAPTWMVGCVGDDTFADIALSGLERHGVHTQLVRRVPGPTGVAHIRVDASGQNDIVVAPMANNQLDEDDVRRAIDVVGEQVDTLLLQFEVSPDVTAYAARRGREAGLRIVLDPAPALDVSVELWGLVDVVTPNEIEASQLTGVEVVDAASAALAAEWFAEHGVRDVVLTLGDRGAVLLSEGQLSVFEAPTVEVVDTTAAGDALTGTLAAALSMSCDRARAVRCGVAAGALAVTRRGASDSLPTRENVLTLVGEEPQATASSGA